MTFVQLKSILQKKDKKQLNQRLVFKELRRSDFLIAIEEYAGTRETPLLTTKKIKNIKRHKRHKNIKKGKIHNFESHICTLD